MSTNTLSKSITKTFQNLGTGGVDLLRYMSDALDQVASENHNYDCAVQIAAECRDRGLKELLTSLRMITQARFGDRVRFVVDSTHRSGFRMKYKEPPAGRKWPEGEIAPSNHWAMVSGLVVDGKSILDKDVRDAIRKEVNPPTERGINVESRAKAVAKFLIDNGIDEGVFLGILREQEKEYRKEKAEKDKKEDQKILTALKSRPDLIDAYNAAIAGEEVVDDDNVVEHEPRTGTEG